jgi:hypothetical protein
VEIGRITVRGQTGEQVSETPISIRSVLWHVLVNPAVLEAIGRRILGSGQKAQDLPKKQLKSKKGLGV